MSTLKGRRQIGTKWRTSSGELRGKKAHAGKKGNGSAKRKKENKK